MFDLNTNFFELFELEVMYQIDLKYLKSKYLELQKKVHPDNFATGSDAEQRMAMQCVSYLNQAYDALKSPLNRAIYLLECAEQDFDKDTQISSDPIFLMEQMELRESLSEVSNKADPFKELDMLLSQASRTLEENKHVFERSYNSSDWLAAREEINKMMFVSKLINEIAEKEEALLD